MADLKDVKIEVEGMTCTNCALGVTKYIEKSGARDVSVNFQTNEAKFKLAEDQNLEEIITGINKLGYKASKLNNETKKEEKGFRFEIEQKLLIVSILTVPLLLHMFIDSELLHSPDFQLALTIPVLIIATMHFGKSALGSIKTRVLNMDVLIYLGIVSAFVYSVTGHILYYNTHQIHNFLFYETAASIACFALLGNYIEKNSVKRTTSAILELTKLKPQKARLLEAHDGHTHITEINAEDVRRGDILMINEGDAIPVDGIVIEGNAFINEGMISGELIPVEKRIDDKVVCGTINTQGNLKIRADKVGSETMLSHIIELVKDAQLKKPSIQKLGDQISAIFVPVVLGLSALTFVLAFFVFGITFKSALLNGIAVLVISCPCALGLATPTAISVAIGRAAKKGILIKGASVLEDLTKADVFVFDKTGTLTTGDFTISSLKIENGYDEQEIKNIIFTLEHHSSHPIAKSMVKQLGTNARLIELTQIEEVKGKGISASFNGKSVFIGGTAVLELNTDSDLVLSVNNTPVAFITIADTIKEHAPELINYLLKNNRRVIMLSGDKDSKCKYVADKLNIKEYYHSQLPQQKISKIEELSKLHNTVMVGDGINDAPALTKAHIGISLSSATEIAIQSAQIVLSGKNELEKLINACELSKATIRTIKQNYFWAFIYNVIAIPIAATGFLTPMIGALSMAFSDVVVVGNSLLLNYKKLYKLVS